MESDASILIGHWKPDNDQYEIIIFDYKTYNWGEEKGKWAIQGNEIWLMKENLHDGIKWVFELKDNNHLILRNPEDFLYQRGGNYLYYQMTSPNLVIGLKRI